MRDIAWWALPGLIVAGPLALFLHTAGITIEWPAWLVGAPVFGFVLHQGVRWRFEQAGNGFRNPDRAALATIIERGRLGDRPDRGDVAYQVYEVVFYQRPDWQPVRDHLHRCWHCVFWFRTIALASWLGTGISALALLRGGPAWPAFLALTALPAAAVILNQKAEQTLAALHLFDRGVVQSHWPLYEAVLQIMRGDSRQ